MSFTKEEMDQLMQDAKTPPDGAVCLPSGAWATIEAVSDTVFNVMVYDHDGDAAVAVAISELRSPKFVPSEGIEAAMKPSNRFDCAVTKYRKPEPLLDRPANSAGMPPDKS